MKSPSVVFLQLYDKFKADNASFWSRLNFGLMYNLCCTSQFLESQRNSVARLSSLLSFLFVYRTLSNFIKPLLCDSMKPTASLWASCFTQQADRAKSVEILGYLIGLKVMFINAEMNANFEDRAKKCKSRIDAPRAHRVDQLDDLTVSHDSAYKLPLIKQSYFDSSLSYAYV